MANTLFLYLEAPLQSWGERGRWSIRDTAPEPTKSGIIGLLGCAMGVSQDDRLRNLSTSLQMGVRIDKHGGRLTDYHTIGGGYDTPQLLTAQGKPKKSGKSPHTELSYRDYLTDAAFLVALQGDEDLIANAAQSIQNPTWVIFLGRKSCVPARPVYDGTEQYSTLAEALQDHNWPEQADTLQAVIECAPTDSNAVRRRDHLVSRSKRLFHPRYTRTISLAPATVEVQTK